MGQHKRTAIWSGLLVGLTVASGCGGSVVPRSFSADEINLARARVTPLSDGKNTSAIARLAQRPILREVTISETAADALARIGTQALPDLIAGLRDPHPTVRSNAAKALSRLGPSAQEAVPALVACLADDDRQVRLNAARALGQVGPGASAAIPPLSEAMREVDTPPPPTTLAAPGT